MIPRIIFLLLFSLFFDWAPGSERSTLNYRDDIRPIFEKHCFECHNAERSRAGLNLTSWEAAIKGSSGGPVLQPGSPDSSTLYQAITHAESVAAMPEDAPKLPAPAIDTISRWISQGLLDVPGGKLLLRKMDFDPALSSSAPSPDNRIFPENLNPIEPNEVVRPLPIVALAINPWGDLFAVNGYEQILLYGKRDDGAPFQLLGILPFSEGDIHDLAFSRDGQFLVAGGGIGGDFARVAVLDVRTGERRATIDAGDEDVALGVDISSDNRVIAVGNPLKEVKMISVQSGQVLHRIRKHTDWVTRVRFSPDGQWLASSDRNGGIHVWETSTGGIVYTLTEHKAAVTSLDWRADGKLLVSGDEEGKLVLWDMKDGFPVRVTKAHEKKSETRYTRTTGILDLHVARNGNIVTLGRDLTLKIWKPDASGRIGETSLPSLATRLATDPAGIHHIIAGRNGDIRIWNSEQKNFTQEIPSPYR